ncbi:hypothetical protein LCGC14_1497720 [marine sediment metagenome]|uniref:Uncharacterized protein n=1 Tax=marine sediment metagenome TaxID=412755 RepID=A0A0F9LKN4_9ZZZZ
MIIIWYFVTVLCITVIILFSYELYEVVKKHRGFGIREVYIIGTICLSLLFIIVSILIINQ